MFPHEQGDTIWYNSVDFNNSSVKQEWQDEKRACGLGGYEES